MRLRLFQLLVFSILLLLFGWSDGIAKAKPTVFTLKDFPLGVGSQWVYARIDSSSSGTFPEGITKRVVMDTVTIKIVEKTKSEKGHSVGIWVREFKSKVDSQQHISLIGAENPKSRKNLEKKDTCIQQSAITPNVSAVDTQYVSTIGDTVVFSRRIRISTDTTRPLREQELFRFVFPMVAGRTWRGAFPDDSSTVSYKESVEVIQNEFKQGFFVERHTWIPNSSGEATYWLVPGVGVVRRENRYEYSFRNLYGVERWKLIRYEVKK